jgi:hypothetical protein
VSLLSLRAAPFWPVPRAARPPAFLRAPPAAGPRRAPALGPDSGAVKCSAVFSQELGRRCHAAKGTNSSMCCSRMRAQYRAKGAKAAKNWPKVTARAANAMALPVEPAAGGVASAPELRSRRLPSRFSGTELIPAAIVPSPAQRSLRAGAKANSVSSAARSLAFKAAGRGRNVMAARTPLF